MGEIQSTNYQCSYLKSVTFVESNNESHFGSVDIYRMNESPFEYMMALCKYFADKPQDTQNFVKTMNKLKSLQHKNLSKIYHCQSIQQIQLCMKTKGVFTFHSFYNFTLQQAIQRKKLHSDLFNQEELLYVLDCLLDLGLYLKSFNISLGQYSCRTIFLSPQGHLKLYLAEFDESNRHSCFFKAIQDKRKIQEFILAPQQLHLINQMKAEVTYDVYKADVFAMAMVILELISLQKSKFYYSEDKTTLKIDRIAFNISNNSSNYSDSFIKLMKACLHPHPANRFSLEMAYEQLKKIRRQSKVMLYSLKFKQEKSSKKTQVLKKSLSIPLKTQFILNGLQKRLKQPQPLNFKICKPPKQSSRRRVITQYQ